MNDPKTTVGRLKSRPQFLAVREGEKRRGSLFLLEVLDRKRPDSRTPRRFYRHQETWQRGGTQPHAAQAERSRAASCRVCNEARTRLCGCRPARCADRTFRRTGRANSSAASKPGRNTGGRKRTAPGKYDGKQPQLLHSDCPVCADRPRLAVFLHESAASKRSARPNRPQSCSSRRSRLRRPDADPGRRRRRERLAAGERPD